MQTHDHHGDHHGHGHREPAHHDEHSHSHGHGHGHVHEDMLSVEEAFARIMECFSPLEEERKPILECLGQVLAEDMTSPLDLPPLANSGMDGYAVIQRDIAGAGGDAPKHLEVIGTVAAGEVSAQTVTAGTAITDNDRRADTGRSGHRGAV